MTIMTIARLKVLMISSDRNIGVAQSAVSERMKEYGKLVSELHIVLLSDRSHKLKNQKLGENVWVYPTNSLNKFLRPLDAVKIGRRIDCNLITTQDPFECGWVGARLKQVKKVPLEVQLHTDPNSSQFVGLLNIIRKQIMRQVMKKADSIRDVARLPIYVDRQRIEGAPTFDLHKKYGFKKVLLMVTRLAKEKNIELALAVLKKVRELSPETGLVIVGSGPERFEPQENVVFVGWQEDLCSYYKTADVFIQTSKFEGYGLALVEAGLSGLNVVSTPVGVATRLKNVVIAQTVEEFVKAIQSVDGKHVLELKRELEDVVLTKEMYMSKIKDNWDRTASVST